MNRSALTGGQGVATLPVLFREGQRGQAVSFNTGLLQITNTLADHVVLVSKIFTVTFPTEENLKAQIYSCKKTYLYKQHLT